MRKSIVAFAFILVVMAGAVRLAAVDTADTKLLTQPAVSADRVAFVYANDLWTADLEGRNVRRLTSDVGVELVPAFSPDGSLIAFSGQYDGNTDVYVVPAGGGVPRRLTWHPAADIVQGFTPDGKSVLFVSARFSSNRAYSQLFTVPVKGGEAGMLKVPYASNAEFSPDGRFIAYNPFPEAFTQWKNYRGGRFSRIWIFNAQDFGIENVPQPEGRSNDVDPMWTGKSVVFRSDRNGEFNLFSFDPASKEVKQLTQFKDFPVLSASAGAGRVVFEQAGSLHLYDIAQGKSRRLMIGIATDLPELRERYAKGSQWVRGGGVSPTGARAVFEFRGEIVTVPAEKGDPRNLTQTPGAHERGPAWSPDGKSIAYFSDASGEYELHVRAQDGKGETNKFKLGGSGFYGSTSWSPDSAKIAFADNSLTLYWLDVKTGAVKKIASEYLYQPGGQSSMGTSWSPDSKWLAYTLGTPTFFRRVHVYSLDQDKSFPVTDGLSDVDEPTFDPEGKYLWFLASTDAGPVRQWFDMSNADMRRTSALYLAVLRKDLPNPLAKESDEEKPKEEKKEAEKPADKPAAAPAKEPAKAPEAFRIDFDGLDNRIVVVPVPAGVYSNLQAGEAGKVFYRKEDPPPTSTSGGPGDSSIRLYDLATRKDEAFGPACDGFALTADKKKMLVASRNAWSIIPASGKPQPGQGKLNTDAIEVRVVPEVEWKQIFDEAWRINRDFFYDPNFHGADWKAMEAKYAAFLPHIACRSDLNRVIQWMCSELAVGHHRVGGGDFIGQPARVAGGLLGADYAVENGRYRFKKVYGGLNWTPELRSPLAEPGVDVKAGEYLLAVEGRNLVPPRQPLRPLRGDGRQDRRDLGRPQPRRHGLADGQGRAHRRRRRPAQPRLGRGQHPQGPRGHERPGRLCLRPEYDHPRPRLFQALLLPAGRQGSHHRRRALQRRRLGRRLLPRLAAEARLRVLGHALRGRPEDAERLDPGPQGHDHQRDSRFGRRPPALHVAEVRDGQARRHGDLGRPRRHPRLPRADGRRLGDGAQPGHLDRGGLHRRERRRPA